MATDMQGRPAWVQTTEKCRYFNGIQNGVCGFGVKYDSVKDKSKPFRENMPCFIEGIAIPCSHRSFWTEEEAKAKLEEAMAHGQAYMASIANGICPICQKAITKKQVGRCVYAEPCGHRLYQGTIPKKAST